MKAIIQNNKSDKWQPLLTNEKVSNVISFLTKIKSLKYDLMLSTCYRINYKTIER